MLIGHSAAAFALVAALTRTLGRSHDEALTLALTAAVFATLPDIDMVYSLYILLTTTSISATEPLTSFWAVIHLFHRQITHSLIIYLVLAALLGTIAVNRHPPTGQAPQWRTMTTGSTLLFGGMILSRVWQDGTSAIIMVGLLLGTGCLAFFVLLHQTGISPYILAMTATAGLVSHPFGDLFVEPLPSLFYPFQLPSILPRLTLSGDPTLNVLGLFLLEAGLLAAAVVVYARFTDHSVTRWGVPSLIAGLSGALVASVFHAPTLETAHPFVVTVVVAALGSGVYRGVIQPADSRHDRVLAGVVTGTATLLIAGGAYTVLYLWTILTGAAVIC